MAGVAASAVLLVVDIVKSVQTRQVSVRNLCLDAYPVIGTVMLYVYLMWFAAFLSSGLQALYDENFAW